ncbi:HNH endonuclease family protein [Pseudonocardia sp. ICBG1142]|uniref:HNH endonuclease family protein n=1 Tax=Pseudonocardia sp. ICBG1142 TaxID=2846760 RepID=UPI001CF68566|nr:HNH endonuclease family protein [Pseudonocardia sp. ICBG1142]
MASTLPESAGAPAVETALAAPTAVAELPPLRIAEDGPADGYRRSEFGDGWAAAVGPGCDVRAAVLARDMVATTVEDGCDVTAGTLADPYSGETITGPSREVDVDHIVPLSLAWRTGAAHWSDERREAFANDLANLRAVSARDNRSKGDKGPEEWLPDTGGCAYARDFAAVSARWELTVSPARVHAVEGACG